MPSHVRIFWWLSVAIVTYWIFSTAWHLLFPTARYLTVLAKLPAELREEARRADIWNGVVLTSFWSIVTLGSAWLAAFRHLNWARWTFAIAFLIRQLIPFAIFAAYHQLNNYIAELSRENWTDPLIYTVLILEIIAISCVFSKSARAWFTSPTVIA
jgi:hypothetical protein